MPSRHVGEWGISVDRTGAYREHIIYSSNSFCKVVIRCATINTWCDRNRGQRGSRPLWAAGQAKIQTLERPDIISEKEDGVAFANEILSMTPSQYILQKVVVGFLFGSMSLSWQHVSTRLPGVYSVPVLRQEVRHTVPRSNPGRPGSAWRSGG